MKLYTHTHTHTHTHAHPALHFLETKVIYSLVCQKMGGVFKKGQRVNFHQTKEIDHKPTNKGSGLSGLGKDIKDIMWFVPTNANCEFTA